MGRGATDQESKEDQELRTLTAEMSGLHWNKRMGRGKCLGWRGLGYGVSKKNREKTGVIILDSASGSFHTKRARGQSDIR